MWIFLNEAFVSLENHPVKTNYLIVKACRDGDIQKIFADVQVWEEETGECRFRALVSRQEAAYAVMDQVIGINYFKFEESITDKTLEGIYSRVWSTLIPLGRVRERGPEMGSRV